MTLVTGINASLARWHWQADEGLTCRLRQGRGGKPPKHPRFQNIARNVKSMWQMAFNLWMWV